METKRTTESLCVAGSSGNGSFGRFGMCCVLYDHSLQEPRRLAHAFRSCELREEKDQLRRMADALAGVPRLLEGVSVTHFFCSSGRVPFVYHLVTGQLGWQLLRSTSEQWAILNSVLCGRG